MSLVHIKKKLFVCSNILLKSYKYIKWGFSCHHQYQSSLSVIFPSPSWFSLSSISLLLRRCCIAIPTTSPNANSLYPPPPATFLGAHIVYLGQMACYLREKRDNRASSNFTMLFPKILTFTLLFLFQFVFSTYTPFYFGFQLLTSQQQSELTEWWGTIEAGSVKEWPQWVLGVGSEGRLRKKLPPQCSVLHGSLL